MKSGKKNVVLIVIMVLIILILGVTGVGAYVYLKTDLLKTNSQLFTEYMQQTIGQMEDILEINKLQEIANKVSENSNEAKVEVAFESEDFEDINDKALTMNIKDDKLNKKLYNNIEILDGEDKIIEAEYIITEEAASLRIIDVVEQYLTIENSDLEKLSANLGMEEDTLNQIFNFILYKGDSEFNIKVEEEEKSILKQTYTNIITSSLTKDNFSRQKDVMITINGNTITTNAYILSISAEEYKVILQKMIEQLRDDEIILNKISDIEINIPNKEEIYLSEKYIEYLDNIMEQLDEEEIEDLNITVYELEDKTVRIKVEQGLSAITIDPIEDDQISGINIKNITIEDSTENSKEVNFTKYKNESYNLEIELKIGEEQALVVGINALEDENNINLEASFEIINEEKSAKMILENNISIVEKAIKIEELTSENNVIINNLTPEICERFFPAVGDAIIETYPKISEIILRKIVYNMATDVIEETSLTEEYNAKFEQYEGTEISGSKVNDLIKTVLNHNLSSKDLSKKVSITGAVSLTVLDTTALNVDTEKIYTVKSVYDPETQYIIKMEVTENK